MTRLKQKNQPKKEEDQEEQEDLGLEVEMGQILECTLRQLAELDMTQQPPCIVYTVATVLFELKSGLIHLMPTFKGSVGEDPHKHLKVFHVVCDGMRPHGVIEEQLNLRAFFDFIKGWS